MIVEKEIKESIFEKELNIFYDTMILNKKGLKEKDLPQYAIILPSQKNHPFTLFGVQNAPKELTITPAIHPFTLTNLICGIATNPLNKPYFPNNHINIYVPNTNWNDHIEYLKKNFKNFNEYLERDQ